MLLKFIGMAPKVEHAACILHRLGEKAIGQGHQRRIIVVAGGLQAQPILGQRKGMGGNDGAGIVDAAGAKRGYRIVIKSAEGIGHAGDDAAEHPLQVFTVKDHFPHLLTAG